MKQFIAAAAAVVLMAVTPAAAVAAGSISGVVTSETTDAPVSGLRVEVYAAGALRTSACTQAAGDYTVAGLDAGTYTVRFIDDPVLCGTDNGNFAPEWYDSRSLRANAVPVAVADGADTGNISASLRPAAEISGTVTDAATGAPVPNVTVEFLDTEFTAVNSTCSAAPDGTYRLRPLPFGVYFVKFIADGRCGPVGTYITQYYDGVSTTASAQFISLVAGQAVPGVNARLLSGVPAELTVSTTGAGTVTSDTGAIACPDRCRAIVPRDSTITLTARAADGSTFTGWSGGGCSGTAPCAVAMNGAQTVTATFAAVTTPPAGDPGAGGPGTGTPATPSTTPARPETRILKASINARRGTAKFTLAGSGGVAPLRFECSLAKKGAKAKFKRCGSTVSYKRLKKGAYVFTARARDARGQLDSSPATRRLSSRRR
jgi:hypothetical protein